VDDTYLNIQDSLLNNIHNKIDAGLTSIRGINDGKQWMVANTLTLNFSISNYIILFLKHHYRNPKLLTSSNNFVIPLVANSKYLCVSLATLCASFKPHIDALTKKMLSRAVGILSKIKLFLNTPAFLEL